MKNQRLSHALSLLVTLLSVAVAAWSQETSVPNLPAQPIGKHDLLSISVYNAPEFSRTVRVSQAGDIELPMMKRAVHAAELTPVQLEAALSEALEADRLLVHPAITVTVAEYQSRTVTVTGAVRKPIVFQQLGPLTLGEVLSRAEGLSPDAAEEIVIARAPNPSQPGKERRLERITMKRNIEGLLNAPDVQIDAGDEIRVPVAEKIFVVGSVRKPGAYPAESDRGTVLSILAVSEGLLPYAMKTAYVYRKAPGGRRELWVPLAQILSRKAPDMPLEAGDVFYVPDNKGRRLTLTTLDRIVNFGAGTTSGMLIWRR